MDAESFGGRRYEAKDIKALLGVDRNRLFYWLRTYRLLEPAERSGGTGRRGKFSFTNLLELALIYDMERFGLDLDTIKLMKDSIDRREFTFSGPGDQKKKIKGNIYARAFSKDPAMAIRITRTGNQVEVYFQEWRSSPLSKTEDEEILKHATVLIVNISTIAKQLLAKINRL